MNIARGILLIFVHKYHLLILRLRRPCNANALPLGQILTAKDSLAERIQYGGTRRLHRREPEQSRLSINLATNTLPGYRVSSTEFLDLTDSLDNQFLVGMLAWVLTRSDGQAMRIWYSEYHDENISMMLLNDLNGLSDAELAKM